MPEGFDEIMSVVGTISLLVAYCFFASIVVAVVWLATRKPEVRDDRD